jgi:seryl-tRNA synthetase
MLRRGEFLVNSAGFWPLYQKFPRASFRAAQIAAYVPPDRRQTNGRAAMHDIRLIRENPAAFDAALSRRGADAMSSEILRVDTARRAAIKASEDGQADLNVLTKQAGAAKASGDTAAFEHIRQGISTRKALIGEQDSHAKQLDVDLRDLLLTLPNTPLAEVPDGADESGNVELRRWGTPRTLDFKPAEHFDIKAMEGLLDFATAAKLSGARFVILQGAAIRLHRALAQFMLDTHITEHGLTETWTPVLVKEAAMYGTNQLPKFAEDSYQTTNGWWLIPTAEVTLTNMVADLTLDEATLPIRRCAHTQCFRSEAGSAGRDTSGMLRQHQFEKVEMVSITTPDQSLAEHERMTGCAEAILQKLGLPYRVVVLCAGDMGFGATKTHDLEVWLPGQNTYREISSVSVCGDFQARRMNARYRPAGGGKPDFVHTLNGSGLAVGRTLIAVLENGQQADGSVTLPAVLSPYMMGATRITADGTLT